MAKSVPAVTSSRISKKEKKQKKLQRKLSLKQANSTTEVSLKKNDSIDGLNLVDNLKTILGVPSGSPVKGSQSPNDSSDLKKKRKRDSNINKSRKQSKKVKLDHASVPSDAQSLTCLKDSSKSAKKPNHKTLGVTVTKKSKLTKQKDTTVAAAPFPVTSLFGIHKPVNKPTEQSESSSSDNSSDEKDDDDATEQSASGSGESSNAQAVECPASSSQDSSDEEELSQGALKKSVKKSKLEREMEKQQQELELRKAERTGLGQEGHVPQSELEFKALLQRNSASSVIWIQYISFLIEERNHARAHAVAWQGLSMIPFEEQRERINLWTVLLRLMVCYPSDSNQSLESVLSQATNNCDDYTILNNMAGIYHEENMLPEAEALYRKLTKKYYAEPETWIQLGRFLYTVKRAEEARETLAKAVKLLKKKLSVDLTSRFAQMEFKLGSSVKGEHMFEALLANYPKRLDVWNVYLDILIKQNSIEKARNVLSRMASLSINLSKKAAVFKKWTLFEKTHGSEEHQKKAKDVIRAFVAKAEAELDGTNT